MPSKRRRAKTSKEARRPGRRQQKHSWLRTYGLVVGVVVVVVAVVAGFVLLDQAGRRSQTQPGAASPETSMGATDAPIVVVEYADFQCPYCKQFALGPEQQLIKDYVDTGKVRFVFQNLAFIGNESIWAAEAAECAAAQGHFWEYHGLLFEKQGGENTGVFSQANLKQYAADLGLNTSQFNQCLNSGKYLSLVNQQGAEAQRLGIRSTPSILANGKLITNGTDYAVLKATIEAALKGQ
jgi:protein-disulfide isomerase